MEKILELGEPIITCYPNYGNVLSIVSAKTEDYLPWIYNYFVQLGIPNSKTDEFRLDYSIPDILRDFPWLEYQKVERKMVHKKWSTFCEFVVDMINSDNYVYTLLNTYYLSHYSNYCVENALHESLIYGYDEKLKFFYVADNMEDGRYRYEKFAFQDIENAEKGIEKSRILDWYNGILILKNNEYFDYGWYDIRNHYNHIFDCELYRELLRDYLECRPSMLRWPRPIYCSDLKKVSELCCGIDVYKYIERHINYSLQNKNKIDIRGFFVLGEHKKIRKSAILYLIEKKHIKNADELLVRVEKCIKYSDMIKNLVIKYNLTMNTCLISRIEENVQKLRADDIEMVKMLRNML